MPFNIRLPTFSEEGEVKLSRRNRIKLEYLHEIRELERRIDDGSVKVHYRTYFRLTKEFFVKLLRLKKGLTWEEILQKTQEAQFKESVRPKIVEFLKGIPEEEYGGAEPTKEVLNRMIKDFKWILKEI